MGVVAVWQCDRDGRMFADKKEAEEHDKMLELAENISSLIQKHLPSLSEQDNEAIGLLLAEHREVLAKACKGKPEALLEIEVSTEKPATPKEASAEESEKAEQNTKVSELNNTRASA